MIRSDKNRMITGQLEDVKVKGTVVMKEDRERPFTTVYDLNSDIKTVKYNCLYFEVCG